MADKIKTLSAAIRYGSTFLEESQLFMEHRHRLDQWDCGCAIGTAYLAAFGLTMPYKYADEIFAKVSERFNVPRETLERVSFMHYDHEKTRAQCADWLEARGY